MARINFDVEKRRNHQNRGRRDFFVRKFCTTNDEEGVCLNISKEMKSLFSIALQTVATQFSIYFIHPIPASSVSRHVCTDELTRFSLASLTGKLVTLSIVMSGLVPRAFGA